VLAILEMQINLRSQVCRQIVFHPVHQFPADSVAVDFYGFVLAHKRFQPIRCHVAEKVTQFPNVWLATNPCNLRNTSESHCP